MGDPAFTVKRGNGLCGSLRLARRQLHPSAPAAPAGFKQNRGGSRGAAAVRFAENG